MKLGIMQPYFCPYIGYFALIAHTDQWVVFDITQYTRKTWMNRNRIAHPTKGWQYITVPVIKAPLSTKIYETKILDLATFKKESLIQIELYKKHAPFYEQVKALIIQGFENTLTDSLVELNVNFLKVFCQYLAIPFNYLICSEENFPLPDITHPGQWALEISTLLQAHEYVNPLGGQSIFHLPDFIEREIKLSFLSLPALLYNPRPWEFIENLSIIDVLMWVPVSTVRKFIYEKAHLAPASIPTYKVI